MSAESNTLVTWQEAFGADPFVILCCRLENREQFIVVPSEGGKRLIVEALGFPIAAPIAEFELRNRLIDAGLSERDAHARIQLAREWTTNVTQSG